MWTNIALFAQQMSAAKCLSTALLVSLVSQTLDWEWAAGATVGAGPDHRGVSWVSGRGRITRAHVSCDMLVLSRVL